MHSSRRLPLCALAAIALFTAIPSAHAPEQGQHPVCENVRVASGGKDHHRIADTVMGAAAGGLQRHQVGGSRGETFATIGGAGAGVYASKKVQEHHQDANTGIHAERRCRWVD